MPLIQDIVPPGGKRDRTLQAATQTAKRLHKATQLSNLPQSRMIQRVQSFDMLEPRRSRPAAPPVPPPQPAPAVAPKTGPAKRSLWGRLGEFAQYPLIAAMAIAVAYNSAIGQAAVGVYGVLALVLRINSRFSFGAALLLLASIPGFQALNLSGVAQKAAIYAYELLVLGTVQAVIELLLDNRRKTS